MSGGIVSNVPTHCQRTSPFSCTCINLKATYQHQHGLLTRQWTVQPAISNDPPGPDSTPHPSPCPDDGAMCNCVFTKCSVCGHIKYWP